MSKRSSSKAAVAAATEQAMRFAAYTAALDQERTAAAAYAEWLGALEQRRPDSDGSRR
jgi:hypothetical protein